MNRWVDEISAQEKLAKVISLIYALHSRNKCSRVITASRLMIVLPYEFQKQDIDDPYEFFTRKLIKIFSKEFLSRWLMGAQQSMTYL